MVVSYANASERNAERTTAADARRRVGHFKTDEKKRVQLQAKKVQTSVLDCNKWSKVCKLARSVHLPVFDKIRLSSLGSGPDGSL